MDLLIQNAHAAANSPSPDGTLSTMLMFAVFGLIFYFIIYRPQAARSKSHKELVASISAGDEILISSGLMGKVTKVFNDNGCLLVALNTHLEVVIKKEFVSEILPKGTLKALC